MTGEIEIDVSNATGDIWIGNISKVQMYAGDPGTEVCATVSMNKNELKTHIVKLIKVWRGMKGDKNG